MKLLQERQQFYYVVKLHMDAFKWLVSIAHRAAHFMSMQHTERGKNIRFYCMLFCNDDDGDSWNKKFD